MREQWVKREKKTLLRIGLSPQPGSGNGEMRKEDGESDRLLAQLKSTAGKAISLRLLDWQQLDKHAFAAGKTPLFLLEFVDGPLLLCFRPDDFPAVVKHFEENTDVFVHTAHLPTLEDDEDILKFL